MRFEINSPAIILPTARRRIGFMVFWFSSIGFIVNDRLVPSRVK